MRIDEVLDQTIIAIFTDEELAKELVLKGGSAMRIFDHENSRLSFDADFSTRSALSDEKTIFGRIQRALEDSFGERNLDVIDFQWSRRPKIRKRKPDWWGGWRCDFKLVDKAHRKMSLASRRRHAKTPDGATSPKVVIEISEHEYCGHKRSRKMQGISIQGYSRELVVLEKLRAICQQHPRYPHRSAKNRARDFYDIYRLTRSIDDVFMDKLKEDLGKVFQAKDVDLRLLTALWDDEFIDLQRRGFELVKGTVHEDMYEFDTYLESLRRLVRDLNATELTG